MYWVLTLYYLPSSWSFVSQQDHSSNSFRNWFCGSRGWSFSFQTYFIFHLSEWHLNWLSDRWYKASLQFPPWQSHTLWCWRLSGGEKHFPNVLALPPHYLQSEWVQRGTDLLNFYSTTPVAWAWYFCIFCTQYFIMEEPAQRREKEKECCGVFIIKTGLLKRNKNICSDSCRGRVELICLVLLNQHNRT